MIRPGGYYVRISEAAVRAYVNDQTGPVYAELDRRMTRAQRAAQRFVRVRTGRLLSTIRKNREEYRGMPAVVVLAGKPGLTDYLGYEHDGTVPHVIRARFRKSLRFVSGGQVVFARQVRHPGTRGSKFLTRALPYAGG